MTLLYLFTKMFKSTSTYVLIYLNKTDWMSEGINMTSYSESLHLSTEYINLNVVLTWWLKCKLNFTV